jgi:tetratricopeptide (TPR) repeat protein
MVMSETTGADDNRQRRLEEAMAEYLLAADAGNPPDRSAFLANYPQLHEELSEFLADREAVDQLVSPLRPVEDARRAADETAALTPGGAGSVGASGAIESTQVEWEQTRSLSRGTAVRYFGDYEILQESGRGAMGVVYRARQVSLNRPVALKMIKAGVLADDSELRRFQNEAEAVALLDHAGIVPVYEVGDHDGQKYFSMKLVEGGNLAEQLASIRANPRAAAALLAETAEAVQHAHMRGILHRDLKPANILIDSEGHPHVTDFGLAKRVDRDVEMTETGMVLGTPAYMSPEQASGRRGTITTATDVYGLGAILYAILAGRAPFRGNSVMETLDAVRAKPPEPPTKFNAKVPRDLETICLKCLEKDPRRRYGSAQALADDLHNWLDSRPITARRVSTPERAWLWCKRRPAVAAMSAMALLSLIAGLIVTSVALRRALRAEDEAILQAAAANRRLDQALEAVEDYNTSVGAEVLLGQKEFQDLRQRLLERPKRFYENLAKELSSASPRDRRARVLLARGRHGLGNTLNLLGDVGKARKEFQESISILRDLDATRRGGDAELASRLATTSMCLGQSQHALGDLDGAIASAREAADILARLCAADPGNAAYRNSLAGAYHDIGWAQTHKGNLNGAIASYEECLAIRSKLVAQDWNSLEYRTNLGMTYGNLNEVQQAKADYAEAVRTAREAIRILRTVVADRPKYYKCRDVLADTYTGLGWAQLSAGELDSAATALSEAISIDTQLVNEQPNVAEYRFGLANAQNTLGLVKSALREFDGACASYREAIDLYSELASKYPDVVDYPMEEGNTYNNLGISLVHLHDFKQAEASCRKSVEIISGVVSRHPDAARRRKILGDAYVELGLAIMYQGRPREAIAEFREAIAVLKELTADHADAPGYLVSLANAHSNLGMVLARMRDWESALAVHREGISIVKDAVDRNPRVLDAKSLLSDFYYDAACDLSRCAMSSRSEQANALADEAMEMLRNAFAVGWHDLSHAAEDPDLEPLHERRDFQELVFDRLMPANPFAR